ncbi:hypothetical protein PSQ19_10025 [Devosia algicola]|uniref:Uncharacterized protein n=1 Tax=Devosia algicola TaxID=3026418 RepID=A0ABY7YIW2_9HYPH|nr:hypothetical protein [Devosia algicola]WDR01206.1 hypothetical protein PSQ19_10025 [Devosia algicola]
MSDNVIKFRQIKKKPEKKPERPPFRLRTVPSWLAWTALIVLGCLLSAGQYWDLFG